MNQKYKRSLVKQGLLNRLQVREENWRKKHGTISAAQCDAFRAEEEKKQMIKKFQRKGRKKSSKTFHKLMLFKERFGIGYPIADSILNNHPMAEFQKDE